MNICTVLGNTNSGAGAIYEYLAGRDDVVDPLCGAEFRLLTDPGGLYDLYSIFNTYSPQKYVDALRRFIDLVHTYNRPPTWYRYSLGSPKVVNLEQTINNYLSALVGDTYPHRYIFVDSRKSPLRVLFQKIGNRLGARHVIFSEYPLGVTRREFESLTYSFFSQLFSYDESTHNLAVLHQTGCYWQPVSTTSLLGEPKVICVSRSPFDQYAELKIHKGFTSSGSFIRWHKHLTKMQAEHELDDECVLRLTFEDFVLNHRESVLKVCNHLSIDPTTDSTYKLSLSRPNVGKYQYMLSSEEIAEINSYCYSSPLLKDYICG